MPLPVALVLLILPGYVLVKAIFPARAQMGRGAGGIYLALFTVVGGVAVVVIYTFLLILLAQTLPGNNFFTAEVVGGGLAAITLGLAAFGWWRGAYGWLGRIHPSLRRPLAGGPAGQRPRGDLERLEALGLERDRLKMQLRRGGLDDVSRHRLEKMEDEIKELGTRLREGLE